MEPVLYLAWAAALTLLTAHLFYASLHEQTRLTEVSAADFPATARAASEWSAPLDDVFIHFDFARSIARGHPFEWSEGNGYSSGGTSMAYPFVLALGYWSWSGFRQLGLMVWAAILAATCTFALLLAARRLFRRLPTVASYLAPPLVLGVGALSWSLFSGMEVAFFLAVWAGAYVAWDDLVAGVPRRGAPRRPLLAAGLLGGWCALLTATRPESAPIVALFGLTAGVVVARRSRWPRGLAAVVLVGVPALLTLVLHALANRHYTGETTAAGALVKLELYHPHLSPSEVWDLYRFHVRYQIERVTEYHLAEPGKFGWLVWALGLFALIPRATRRPAAMLWGSAALWVLVVATNGQVRWQNERYTMPAVAWLMLSAALGAGGLLTLRFAVGRRGRWLRLAGAGGALLALGLGAYHQAPRFRDQVWFFGRAARNIRDQHVRTGRLLRHAGTPPPRRVLVGDAGAIPYASDLPALDIIGLGGFRGLPFARATRLGLPAALELIEGLSPAERPDLLALYPSWWGALPLWFGERVGEVPVTGNVICGGASKVLYVPRWERFGRSGVPYSLRPGERVVDALDLADLVSERRHALRLSVPRAGAVTMKLLADPSDPRRELWDGGRVLGGAVQLDAVLRGPSPGRAARLVLRTAPAAPARLRVSLDGVTLGEPSLEPGSRWVEPSLPLPASSTSGPRALRIEPLAGEASLFHVWLLEDEGG